MVAIRAVLLCIQHLQQRRRRIPPVIGPHFVYLIQKQQRISRAGLGQSRHDAARHSAHIGLPVTPDLRLIVNAAQGNPGHLPV